MKRINKLEQCSPIGQSIKQRTQKFMFTLLVRFFIAEDSLNCGFGEYYLGLFAGKQLPSVGL